MEEFFPGENLIHRSCAIFSTKGGYDKYVRLIQYSLKIIGHATQKDTKKALISERAFKLSSIISQGRYVSRFFEFVESIQGLLLALREKDRFIMSMEIVKNVSMLGYYPLEYGYWAKWMELIEGKGIDIDAWSRYTCILWCIYIAADMLIDSYHLKNRKVDKFAIIMKFVKNICDLMMGIHWSIKDSTLLDQGQVGVLGTVGSIAYIARMAKNT